MGSRDPSVQIPGVAGLKPQAPSWAREAMDTESESEVPAWHPGAVAWVPGTVAGFRKALWVSCSPLQSPGETLR